MPPSVLEMSCRAQENPKKQEAKLAGKVPEKRVLRIKRKILKDTTANPTGKRKKKEKRREDLFISAMGKVHISRKRNTSNIMTTL